MAYPIELKNKAKRLFLSGLKPSEIQERLNLKSSRIIYYWADTDGWGELLAFDKPINALDRRLNRLLEKNDGLSSKELNEIERLIAVRDKLKRQEQPKPYEPKDLTKQVKGKKKDKPLKNDISSLTKAVLDDWLDKNLFDYQKRLITAKNDPLTCRSRNVLKSRQIGFTWYFAIEALCDAIITGDNQLFLSASKRQAFQFKRYMINFAKEFGIELKGSDEIELSNGAVLKFLSTNSATAQSYNGHLYIDEYFWIPKYKNLKDVADGMATHANWRMTYFSTPSTLNHEAYPIWSGDEYLNRKDKYAKNKTWPTTEELHKGALCPDGTWRIIIDVEDAVKGGCNLINIERLRLEKTPEVFAQLYMCQFIDESMSVFKLHHLEKCLADPSRWTDFIKTAARPFGDKPVWIGYDPSRTGDLASCVVLAVPDEPGGKFRILEKFQLSGQSFAFQAAKIKRLTERYNVQHIGIDTTGMGYGVFELVKDFFPRAAAIHYSLETKTGLVLKTLDVMVNSRLVWDGAYSEIASAFLTIKQTTTQGGHITYSTNRTTTTGHADIAWAIMHALIKEPLNTNKQRRSRYAFM